MLDLLFRGTVVGEMSGMEAPSETQLQPQDTQPLFAAIMGTTQELPPAIATEADVAEAAEVADAPPLVEVVPVAAPTEEEIRAKAVEAHTLVKKCLIRNHEFAHYGRLPHFTNSLCGDVKPFVRIKVSESAEGAVYRLGRVMSSFGCDPYVVVGATGARLDFEIQTDVVDKSVKVTSISNRSASIEEITQYIDSKALTLELFVAEAKRALAHRSELCSEKVKDVEEARKVAARNSALAPQPHLAMQISALQRETTTRFSQVDAGHSGAAELSQHETPATPTRPSAADPQVSTMLDLERQFTSYVEKSLDTPSTALMRDLTLRNRSKNNVSTVQAVSNFKKYPRQATFSDEGLLWEVDAEKRNLLCEQYDEIKEGTIQADDLMPESLRIKPPAPDTRAGMSLVERCVADAVEASQREQNDLSQLDDSTLVTTPLPKEPVSLVRLASRSSKKHRSESQA